MYTIHYLVVLVDTSCVGLHNNINMSRVFGCFFMQPVHKSTETKQQQKETPEVKVQPSQKQKKLPKDKSAADQKLENR